MREAYLTAQIFGYGLVETFKYMVANCNQPYEAIWDFIMGEQG